MKLVPLKEMRATGFFVDIYNYTFNKNLLISWSWFTPLISLILQLLSFLSEIPSVRLIVV